jgi:hypothetical protein
LVVAAFALAVHPAVPARTLTGVARSGVDGCDNLTHVAISSAIVSCRSKFRRGGRKVVALDDPKRKCREAFSAAAAR